MNYFKPYSYLYKIENGALKLKSCFVVLVPSGKSLRGPEIFNEGHTTRIEYIIADDEGQLHSRQEEYENELSWDGEPHEVTVIVGEGSGSNGGSITIDSGTSE